MLIEEISDGATHQLHLTEDEMISLLYKYVLGISGKKLKKIHNIGYSFNTQCLCRISVILEENNEPQTKT